MTCRIVADAEYVSFSSAGTKGFVFLGFLDALEDHLAGNAYEEWRQRLRGVYGTSAGTLAALSVALGLNGAQRREAMMRLADVRSVLRNPDVSLLIQRFGFEDGRALRECVEHMLVLGGVSPVATLGDLRRLLRIDFVCVATDLIARRASHLSARSRACMRVTEAVYASCAIPFMFPPMRSDGAVFVDGCLVERQPVTPCPERTLFVTTSVPRGAGDIATWSEFIAAVINSTDELQGGAVPKERMLSLQDEAIDAYQLFEINQTTESSVELARLGYVRAADLLTHGALLEGVLRCVLARAVTMASTAAALVATEDDPDE